MIQHSSDPPPFFKGGEVNFKYFPQGKGRERGESEKLKKTGWKYGAGAGLLKRGSGTFPI